MKSPDRGMIASLADLQAEMQRAQARIQDHEQTFAQKWKKIPGEALKSVMGSIIPVFIGGELGAGAFKLIKGIFELIKNKKGSEGSESDWRKDLTGGAAKLGLFTGLKLLFSLWKGK